MKDKETKRREAAARNEAWQKLSAKQQLAALDKRFGKGKGATKQRARINERLSQPVSD